MSALPICDKLRKLALGAREGDVRGQAMLEADDIIRALYEALLLVSRNSGKLYNDEWQFVESTLAKARGEQ